MNLTFGSVDNLISEGESFSNVWVYSGRKQTKEAYSGRRHF